MQNAQSESGKMKIQDGLSLFNLIENVDYVLNGETIVALPKYRQIPKTVVIPETGVILNEQGGVLAKGFPDQEKIIMETEEYFSPIPDIEKIRIKFGSIARLKCQKVLAVVASYNYSLTAEQIDAMVLNFAPIIQALQLNRPDTSYNLILNIPVDGVLIKQEMKDMILKILSE